MGDYFGSDGYLTGLGFRKQGSRPVTISKSLLSDLDEDEDYYYDSFGVKRRRKKGVTELSSINVEEISLVDKPATRKKFMVIKNLEDKKGDDNIMDEEKELKGWEDVSEKELSVIKETISILNKYDLVDDLKRARETLTKYFGESEVKKYSNKCEWSTVQNQLYGFTEDDLAMVSDEEIYEVSKSSEDDKFPSLSRILNRNKRVLERVWEERNLESRVV